MQTKDYIIGIDTSNYKTSVAVTGTGGGIIADLRRPLIVKQGEKGLRQSYALFQHIEALPVLIGEAVNGRNERIAAVAVSTRPRPVSGSYMPVFRAGESFATVISHALNIPVFTFSHQEGHIEAVKSSGGFKDKSSFLCYHLSGGTCELLKVCGNKIDIIGGSKDISFGQVIDRAGVRLGMPFPCGAEFDRISLETDDMSAHLKDIPNDGLKINLSGLDTQAARVIEKGLNSEYRDMFVKEILNKISNSLIALTEKAVIATDIKDILFTGGVSSSRFIFEKLHAHFNDTGIKIEFGNQGLSSDNAVGIALLGGHALWQ